MAPWQSWRRPCWLRAASISLLLGGSVAQGPPLPEAAVPPGLRPWLGRDRCGDARWIEFHAALGEVARHFNAYDFPTALSQLAGLLLPLVADPHVAFDCATAVAAALAVSAQCGEQLRLPSLGCRLRQLAAIFSSFDYQMKGEEYIDQSPWPLQWMPAMEAILQSMTFLKEAELQRVAWRGSATRAAIAENAAVAQRAGRPVRGTQAQRIAIVSVCDYDAGQTPLARLSDINKREYAGKHGYDVIMHESAPIFEDPLAAFLEEPASHRPPAWSKVDAILGALALGTHDWVLWMDCDSFFMDSEVRLEDVVGLAEAENDNGVADSAASSDSWELRQLIQQWLAGPEDDGRRPRGQDLLDWYDDLLARSLGSGEAPIPVANRTLGWSSWLFNERRLHLVASEDGLMLNTGIVLVRASAWSWAFFQKVRWMTFNRSPVTQHPWWEQTAMVYLLQLPMTLAEAARDRAAPTSLAAVSSGAPEDLLPVGGGRGHVPACALLSQRHLNTYPPIVASALKTHTAYTAGDYIISFSGCKIYYSQEVCNQLFLAYFFQVHDIDTFQFDPVLRLWL